MAYDKTREVTHNLEGVDTQQKTRTRGDTRWRIRIHHCKNLTRLYVHTGRERTSIIMQSTLKNKTRTCIFPQKSSSANRAGRMPHPPAGIDTRTDTMSRTGNRVARLHLHCGHGAGGVIFGEESTCMPVLFRWEWPQDIKDDIKTVKNPAGQISNSDLELAGIVLLWIVI